MTYKSPTSESKAHRIDHVLSMCALLAVLYVVFGLASHRYWRAGLAALVFLFVIPWLGKRWINRTR